MKRSWTLEEEEWGFRMASLRLFLRVYSRMRPEVLSALQSTVRPLYLPLLIAGGEEKRKGQVAFWAALDQWIQQFGLPCTIEMQTEAIRTLLIKQEPGRLLFYWDFVREMVKALKREGAHDESYFYPYPFTFQAQGWKLGKESIEEARRRLRHEFENALKAHTAIWYQSQRIGADIQALCQRHKDHARDICWLAQKQARPLSIASIARRHKISVDKVRRRLRSAAECLGGVAIRYAPPGRKPRPSLT